MTLSERKRQFWLIVGSVAVVLLFAAVFTLGSLSTPFHPEQGNAFVILFALSTFIAAALLVFTLILTRTWLRMWAERRAGQIGSRFKVKMVLGAMGVSLLPVVFMFFFSYALVNRTLNAWFPRPLELANEQSQLLLQDMRKIGASHLSDIAAKAAKSGTPDEVFLHSSGAVDASWIVDSHGAVSEGVAYSNRAQSSDSAAAPAPAAIVPHPAQVLRSGAEFWRAGDDLYLAASAPVKNGKLYVGRRMPGDYLDRYSEIQIADADLRAAEAESAGV